MQVLIAEHARDNIECSNMLDYAAGPLLKPSGVLLEPVFVEIIRLRYSDE